MIHKRIEELPIDGPNQAAVRLLLDCLQHGNDRDTPPRLCVRLYNGTLEDAAQFLHAKCYIFYYNSQSTYGSGAVSIVGSSNFTSRGLQGNLELNSIEPDSQVVTAKPTQYNPTKGVAQWYEEHWHLGSPLNKFVEQTVRSSGIGRSLMSFHYTFGSDGKVLTASETIVEREARYTELSAALAEARHEMPAPLQLHFLRLQEFWRNEPARYNALAKCSLPLIAPAGEDAKEQTSMLTVREGGRLHFLAADSSGQYESLPLVTFLDRLYALGQVRGPAPDSASAACQGALTWLRRTQAKVQLNIDHYERASKKRTLALAWLANRLNSLGGSTTSDKALAETLATLRLAVSQGSPKAAERLLLWAEHLPREAQFWNPERWQRALTTAFGLLLTTPQKTRSQQPLTMELMVIAPAARKGDANDR